MSTSYLLYFSHCFICHRPRLLCKVFVFDNRNLYIPLKKSQCGPNVEFLLKQKPKKRKEVEPVGTI